MGGNLYEYVRNSPANFGDPFGLFPRIKPEDTARRPCTPGEFTRCVAMCGDRGVEHCYVAMHRAVVGLTKKGKPKWDWVDSQGALDCSCNEPNGNCEEKRQFPFAPPAISQSTQRNMNVVTAMGEMGAAGYLLWLLLAL